MRCAKAGKLLSLYAGDDLGGARKTSIRRHLERCPACRAELEELRAAMERAGREAAVGAPVWNEAEWDLLIAGIPTEARRRETRGRRGSPTVLRLASGTVAVVLLFVAGLHMARLTPTGAREAAAFATAPDRKVVQVEMVSAATGLKVTWYLDSEFDWKGE